MDANNTNLFAAAGKEDFDRLAGADAIFIAVSRY